MTLERVGAMAPNYAPCHYGMSRLVFRGPRADLGGAYTAFLGGTETFGKFVDRPYPALLEDLTDQPCVNLGSVNAGVDSFVGDPEVLEIAAGAQTCVVQVMGMQNLSNPFYKVHPRRNDRFVSASAPLQAIFKTVDFTEFTFTQHMLSALKQADAERYEIVVQELRIAWSNRMRDLIEAAGSNTWLLWLRPISEGRDDPLEVTEEMIEELRPLVAGIVVADVAPAGVAQELPDMICGPLDTPVAAQTLGPRAHEAIAQALQAGLSEQTGPA